MRTNSTYLLGNVWVEALSLAYTNSEQNHYIIFGTLVPVTNLSTCDKLERCRGVKLNNKQCEIVPLPATVRHVINFFVIIVSIIALLDCLVVRVLFGIFHLGFALGVRLAFLPFASFLVIWKSICFLEISHTCDSKTAFSRLIKLSVCNAKADREAKWFLCIFCQVISNN